jgi:hypothetical protein
MEWCCLKTPMKDARQCRCSKRSSSSKRGKGQRSNINQPQNHPPAQPARTLPPPPQALHSPAVFTATHGRNLMGSFSPPPPPPAPTTAAAPAPPPPPLPPPSFCAAVLACGCVPQGLGWAKGTSGGPRLPLEPGTQVPKQHLPAQG